MLSSPSSEDHVRPPSDDVNNTNDVDRKYESLKYRNCQYNITENVIFTAHNAIPFETDVYWEMNYYEAAIFLEVELSIDYLGIFQTQYFFPNKFRNTQAFVYMIDIE